MSKGILFSFEMRDPTGEELAERSSRMVRTGPPVQLDAKNRSIQFLRGVFSRATMCVPAFYNFLGALSAESDARKTTDHAFRVAQTYAYFSDLNTLTLNCRKIFDHSVSIQLTGANFARCSDSVLEGHAEYWARNSGRSKDDALKALNYLRRVFAECSKNDTQLLKGGRKLQKRIGLLKQHADRAAAHLSLEDYNLNIVDLAHVTAACVIVGEIIRSFDNPQLNATYFNDLDKAAYEAAERSFPQIRKFMLFHLMTVEMQARLYWEWGEENGLGGICDRLPDALGGHPDLATRASSAGTDHT